MSAKSQGQLILRLQAPLAGASPDGFASVGWIVTQLETAGQIVLQDTTARLTSLPPFELSQPVAYGALLSIHGTLRAEGVVNLELSTASAFGAAETHIWAGEVSFTASNPQAIPAAETPTIPSTAADLQEPVAEEPEDSDAELKDFAPHMAPALRDHLKQCFAETYADILSADELETLSGTLASPDVGGMLMDDSRAQLVITIGDRIIGSAMCASQHNITYIWGMYVQKAYQRVGLGHSLIEAILQKLPEKGMVELTVLKSSEPAVNFFTSLGFKGHRSGEIEFVPGKTLEAANMYANVKTLRG